MTLDYIDNINAFGENIIRLYDFDMGQADRFRESVQQNLIENNKSIEITTLDFIQGRNCSLTLRLSVEDFGIHTSNKIHFFCDMSSKAYEQLIALVLPFCTKKSIGHQFLYDIDTPTDFLFSPGGTW